MCVRGIGEVEYCRSTKDGYLTVQLPSVKTLQLSLKEHKGDRLKDRNDWQGELSIYQGLKEEEWQVPRTEKYWCVKYFGGWRECSCSRCHYEDKQE